MGKFLERVRSVTFKEVVTAIGFSVGAVLGKLRLYYLRLVLLILAICAIVFVVRHGGKWVADWFLFLTTLDGVPNSVIAALVATGFCLLGAAAFCYVLFLFLHTLTIQNASRTPSALVFPQTFLGKKSRDSSITKENLGGSFQPDNEDKYYMQEELGKLVEANILAQSDVDEIMKEGGAADFDFDKLKSSMKGVNA